MAKKTNAPAKKTKPKKVAAQSAAPASVSMRDIKNDMRQEIMDFVNLMVDKYRDYDGKDLRRDVSWYLEQFGVNISRDIEKEKRAALDIEIRAK